MRRLLQCTMLVSLIASPAFAQEDRYSQTLDEQLARVKAGKSAIPRAQAEPINAEQPRMMHNRKSSAEAPAAREWPNDANSVQRPASDMPKPVIQSVAPNGEMIDSLGGGAIPALPLQVMMAGDVKFVTGGIGDEEITQLKSVEHEYNTRVVMIGPNGEYMSEVALDLFDDQGTPLVAAESAGPYFYASLKPGSYKVELTDKQGITKTGSFKVPAKGFVRPVVKF